MTNVDFSRVKAVIFDLDGTLIDSKLDLVISVNAMLTTLGRDTLPEETIASFVGSGAAVLVSRALGNSPGEEKVKEALAIFLEHYAQHKLDNTRAYPGVTEALAQLKNHPLAVLTNKPTAMSEKILEGLGLACYFQKVYGGDSFETKKPDPLGANTILREFGVSSPQAVMVGDSEVDVQTGRNAGMLSAIVNYGFGSHDRAKYPADIYLEQLPELLRLLKYRRT
ncbi:MAG TPA: HAD-IA family hydrolase [Terriglobales bacterium]|nr:HAD-IA family hydrolase [Terriglobales bacterium]